jgi:hypothetical protein
LLVDAEDVEEVGEEGVSLILDTWEALTFAASEIIEIRGIEGGDAGGASLI